MSKENKQTSQLGIELDSSIAQKDVVFKIWTPENARERAVLFHQSQCCTMSTKDKAEYSNLIAQLKNDKKSMQQ